MELDIKANQPPVARAAAVKIDPKEDLNKAARALESADIGLLEAKPAAKAKALEAFNDSFKALHLQAKSFANLSGGNEQLGIAADAAMTSYRSYLVDSAKPKAQQDPKKSEDYFEKARALVAASDLAIQGKKEAPAASAAAAVVSAGGLDKDKAKSIINGVVQPKDLEPNAQAYQKLLDKAAAVQALADRANGAGSMSEKLTKSERDAAVKKLDANLPKGATDALVASQKDQLLEKMASSLVELANAKDKRGAEFIDPNKLKSRIDAETVDGNKDKASDAAKKVGGFLLRRKGIGGE